MFTDKDLEQLKEKGISKEIVIKQIENFKKGFPFVKLNRAATLGDGIRKMTDQEISYYENFYKEKSTNKSITKFVPASGAASRMFKQLFNYLEKPDNHHPIMPTLIRYMDFAFGKDIEENCTANDFPAITDYVLKEGGLSYGTLPKGLIKFHKYEDGARTAFQEHLVEGAKYAFCHKNEVTIHFTVSPAHMENVKEHIDSSIPKYEAEYNVKYNISYSVQDDSTDTIAVDLENKPFRGKKGNILFRPAGHGALIENLNKLTADIVFVKNIDNVVPDRLKNETIRYKQALAGLLMSIQDKTFNYLQLLDEKPSPDQIHEIEQFCLSLGIDLHEDNVDRRSLLFQKLNRPIRVCGMVKNQGEPGGGPFWTFDRKGDLALQIVETSQIDLEDEAQKAIVNESTHFNPVDLVCSTKNYLGSKFDLRTFIDPSTGFISLKSKSGKDLKAQERPGLWNGAMANWITIFVEVPVITFNPVKTVTDLLRDEHQ